MQRFSKTRPRLRRTISLTGALALILVVASLFILADTRQASAQNITVTPTQDNWLDGDGKKQDDNHGADTILSVSPEGDKANRAILKFDLSAIPSGATITSATLTLTQSDVGKNATTQSFQVRGLTQRWAEEDEGGGKNPPVASTWNDRELATPWTNAGGTFNGTVYATQSVGTASGPFNWDVTALVQAWHGGSLTNHGLLIKAPTENGGGGTEHEFDSREGTTPPQLSVNYACPVGSITIGNFVWNDLNENGIQDGGEPGIGGVTVALLDAGGAPTGISTTTASNGSYALDCVAAPATYIIAFVPPSSFSFSAANQGSGTNDSRPDPTTGRTAPTAFSANDANQDAGLFVDLSAGGVNGLFYGDGDVNRYSELSADTNGLGTMYGLLQGNTLKLAFLADGIMNDNVFESVDASPDPTDYMQNVGNGTTEAWDKNRSATKLYDSEKLEDIYVSCGANTWQWTQSYLCKPEDQGFPGDGKNFEGPLSAIQAGGPVIQPAGPANSYTFGQCHKDEGTPPPGYTAATSLSWNFNNTNWEPDRSFAGGGSGTPSENWTSPYDPAVAVSARTPNTLGWNQFDTTNLWEWAMVYEMSFDVSLCGDDPITVGALSIHNSPSKGGEDAEFPPAEVRFYDYGDLPDRYGTLITSNGPVHELGGITLGTNIDNDPDGQPTNTADGDDLDQLPDDEDGVLFQQQIIAGRALDIQVNASVGGYLNAWIDWNGDGDFNDPNERIASDLAVYAGNNTITINAVPGNVSDRVYSRFRISTDDPNGALGPNGSWSNGEVEDYLVLSQKTGAIGNYVWVDENSDGFQDAGEPGLPNVTVNLYDSAGTVVATTVTDAQGGYLFSNLTPGSYFVRVDETTLPAGMTQTPPSTLPGADFGNQDQSTGPGDFGYPVTIGSGQENLTADFGYNHNPSTDVNNGTGTAALGDRVWIDADGDGVQDPEEAGLGGVTVQLFTPGPDGIFGTPDDVAGPTDTTDANGNYLFDNLTPGAYVVKVTTPPAGYTQTGDPDHFGANAATNPSQAGDNQTTTPVVLAPGDVFLNADFGYQPPAAQNNSLGNKVWFDANANGVGPNGNGAAPGNDNSEKGIPGVTVALIKDSNGNGTWDSGEPIIATDTTDANGDYLFPGLPDGKYLVWVSDSDSVLGGKTPTYDVNGGAAPTGSGAPISVASGTVLGLSASDLDSGGTQGAPVNDLTQDFGYTAPGQTPTTGLIGDRVWLDINNDGVQDANEPGLEGLTVTLKDSNGATIAVTTTDENGNYYFGGLPAGTYTVEVTPPTGMTQTFDADGLVTPHKSTVTIGGGNPLINLDQDFGYRGSGTIGNLVWEDLNADGVKDAGESGIDGVTLDLYQDLNGNGTIDAGEPLVGSTTTAGGGAYLFDGLATTDNGVGAAGADYIVDVTDEDGVLAGYWHSLGTPNTNDNSQVDPYAASISAGAPDNLTADFGYYVKPAALGNFVWNDLNKDGIQDGGEPGIDGVEVTLTIKYASGATNTFKTVTGDDPSTAAVEQGWYSFGNLLLDEDNAASKTGSATATQPIYTLSVDLAQTVLSNYVVTTANVGGNNMIDSDNFAGVDGLAGQGRVDVAQKADAGTESDPIAGYDFGVTLSGPLAVSFSYAYAERVADGTVYFLWETATETGNAGFNLYMAVGDEAPSLITQALIPSRVVDSVTPVRYTYQAEVAGDSYFIEMVNVDGSRERFGPYALGVEYGEPSAVDPTELVNPMYLPIISGR